MECLRHHRRAGGQSNLHTNCGAMIVITNPPKYQRAVFARFSSLARPRFLRSFLHTAGANCRRERIKTFFGFYCTCYMLHDIKINEFIQECIGAKENHFSTHCVIIIFLHFYCYSFCGEFPNDPQTLCLRRKLSIAKVLMIAVSMEWLI